MNTLREALQEYIDLRRGLGYKMHCEGLLLPRFVSFMEEHDAEHISARFRQPDLCLPPFSRESVKTPCISVTWAGQDRVVVGAGPLWGGF